MSSETSHIPRQENSIIDVTGNAVPITHKGERPALVKYANGVPYWRHQYIYAYSEITRATSEQFNFYQFLKSRFLKGEYFDLEGNRNYAFVLLFDLLNKEYENHKNPLLLERQLEELGYYYPKTKSHGLSFLIQKMEKAGDKEGITRIKNKQVHSNNYRTSTEYSFDGNYWGLGTQYQSKLKLTDDEIKLLNKLFHPGNNFCNIEYCFLEVLKLFLLTIEELRKKFVQEDTTIDQQFINLADIIARKHFNYKTGSVNYKYSIDPIINELYSNLFKHCENALREHYGHKRKLNTGISYSNSAIQAELDAKLFSGLTAIIHQSISKINPPDEATEIELNAQNTSRWKIIFENLVENYKDNNTAFFEKVISLGSLNKKNPSIENIFFEASRFTAKKDKEVSLMLYVHYIYHDLKSAGFDNKKLTKTIQKNLFKTNEQLHDFQILVSDLIKDRDLEKALQAVSAIYKVKRKKIKLDAASIKEVLHQHTGTVELLNEYLKDEYEDEINTIKSQEINKEEASIQIAHKNEGDQTSAYASTVAFTSIQTATLEFFAKNNFSVLENELEAFAKSKGVFKNQLVESINDTCYEDLDDLLIEEEDNYYIINPNYYQRLLAQ